MTFLVPMVVTALLLTSTAESAAAKDLPEETLAESFAHTDSNMNGYADRREYYVRLVDVFYLADLDRNGSLDEKEYEWTALGTFNDADADRDGAVDIVESMNIGATLFQQADADGDGQLSWKEVEGTFEPS